VAKILVADDNSNIQKMVVLALKDQGIDVVAVGNGEAAVRKISDIKPDLVLADIFMPVRNGYEVCKFVKDNSNLSHIPVILLVGAFDPLDEQEAQRVGADGVLKKPFVPADPLISMVKSALTRAGVVIGGVPAMPAPPPPPASNVEPPAPRIVPLPPAVFAQKAEEEFAPTEAASPAPFRIDRGSQPLAFENLLDAPVPEDDAVFAISPSTAAVPERDWSSSSTEEQEEVEEPANGGAWRVSTSLEETVDAIPAGQSDWREAAFSGIAPVAGNGTESAHTGGWAPSVEKQSLSITEEEVEALAREREVFPAISRSQGPEDWGQAIQEVLPEKQQPAPEWPAATVAELTAIPPAPATEVASTQPAERSPSQLDANSWMAGAVSPWESEAQRASRLAATWDTAMTTPAAVVEEPVVALEAGSSDSAALEAAHEEETADSYAAEPLIEKELPEEALAVEPEPPMPAAEAAPLIEALLSPATQEVLHQEAEQVVAEQTPVAATLSGLEKSVSSDEKSEAQPNMDEIVAKVLARMNPDVVQAVTREILKPLVEAMIKDELQKK